MVDAGFTLALALVVAAAVVLYQREMVRRWEHEKAWRRMMRGAAEFEQRLRVQMLVTGLHLENLRRVGRGGECYPDHGHGPHGGSGDLMGGPADESLARHLWPTWKEGQTTPRRRPQPFSRILTAWKGRSPKSRYRILDNLALQAPNHWVPGHPLPRISIQRHNI